MRAKKARGLTVDQRSERVVDVDGKDLPVRFVPLELRLEWTSDNAGQTHVVESKSSKDLDLFHLADVPRATPKLASTSNLLEERNVLITNVDDVDGVVIPGELGKVVVKVGALPCLGDGPVEERVALVRPHVLHEAHGIVLLVVENGVCERVSKNQSQERKAGGTKNILSGSSRWISILPLVHRGISTTMLMTWPSPSSGYTGISCQKEIGSPSRRSQSLQSYAQLE